MAENMAENIVILIGGPSSGKTSIINELENRNYLCYPEISREVIQDAQAKGIDQLFVSNPLLFSELLLEGRINQFKKAQQEVEKVVFIDRGIPDVVAYMEYINSDYPEMFSTACKEYTYSKIFVLPPWEAIHTVDQERYENFEQATHIHKHLVTTYENLGYELIEVPKDSVANRTDFILNHLS